MDVEKEKHLKHLKSVSTYQKANPDKCRDKCKKYHERLKEDPEKYATMLQRKKDYYLNVRKPKIDSEKSKKTQIQSKTDQII
jgi:hypothetical protein